MQKVKVVPKQEGFTYLFEWKDWKLALVGQRLGGFVVETRNLSFHVSNKELLEKLYRHIKEKLNIEPEWTSNSIRIGEYSLSPMSCGVFLLKSFSTDVKDFLSILIDDYEIDF